MKRIFLYSRMKKRIFNFCLLICFVIATVCRPYTAEAVAMPLAASSAVLLDGQTRQVLYSKAPHTKRAPASTTKLLTAMVVLDHLSTEQIIRVPRGMEYVQPSKINLRTGERFYVRDLLKALLVNSANDAAETLAITTAGSLSGFSKLMNQKAEAIGAYNSHFVHPAGLPAEGQYSTAYDLAQIIMAASHYSYIVQVLRIRNATIYSLGGRKIYLKNCNKMLWRTNTIIGKTGWTRNARHCFAGRVQVGGKEIFVGIMGAPKRQNLWSDLRRIAALPSARTQKSGKGSSKKVRNETEKIQLALKHAGYFKGSPTGFYGKRTKQAVKNFQKANGLSTDGIVGPETWKKLKAYL